MISIFKFIFLIFISSHCHVPYIFFLSFNHFKISHYLLHIPVPWICHHLLNSTLKPGLFFLFVNIGLDTLLDYNNTHN